MNFDKLFAWIVGIAISAAALNKLDTLQRWIWIQQAKVVSESRTARWGSPRFFPEHSFTETKHVSNYKKLNQESLNEAASKPIRRK